MTETMPKVSVIIPNYNHARYLRQRIESVLGQTYRDFELILLDDFSTDESRSIIDEYGNDPRVRIELNDKNSGSTFKQWNKGVWLASGEYIWIAESDDYADELLLERLVAVLDDETELTFAYCRSWQISEDDQKEGFGDSYLDYFDTQRWKADFRAVGRDECREYFFRTNPVPNASAVVFRKAIYKRVGGADESLRMCGDWKLWAAMALEGRIAYVSEPLNYYRAHGASMRNRSKREGLGTLEALTVIRWIIEREKPTQAGLELLPRTVARFWPYEIMSPRVPLHVKRAILRDARAIDPGALRKLIHPAWVTFRLKIAKELRLIRQRFENRVS